MSDFIRLSVPRQQDVQSNSIVVNANENTIAAANSDACYITPIRNQSGFPQSLYYNPATGEIAYADISGGGGGGGSGGTGPTGPAGSAGPTGATGMTGPQGGFGGVTTCFYQDPDSNLIQDPTAGYMYFRTATTQYAASMLIVDASDCNQTNITEYMKTIMDSPNPSVKGHVRVSDSFSGTDNYLLYEINDLSYSGATPAWFEISVNGVASSSPSPFNPSLYPPNELYLTFARMGDIGAEGPQGVTGPTGPAGSGGGGGGASPWNYDSSDNFYGPTGMAGQVLGTKNVIASNLNQWATFEGSGNIGIGWEVTSVGMYGTNNTFIGYETGGMQSGDNNICIGTRCGGGGGQSNNILLGQGAGQSGGLGNGGLVINATSATSLTGVNNGCVIKPIASGSQVNALYYNTGTGEVTYDTAAGGGGGGTNHWKAATLPDGTNVLEPSANDISGIKLMNTIFEGTDREGIMIGVPGNIAYGQGVNWAIAIGERNRAMHQQSIAIGFDCSSTGILSIAMGYECDASGPLSWASGSATQATGAACVAMGQYNIAGPLSSAFAGGEYNEATGYASTAFGSTNTATATCAVAMGFQCDATGRASVALGEDLVASGDNAVVMGKDCSAVGFASFAMGGSCDASGQYSVAMGYDNTINSIRSTAFGSGNDITGDGNNFVAGKNNIINGFCCGALGRANEVGSSAAQHAMAFGQLNKATGNDAVTIGYECEATNGGTIAMGSGCRASGFASVAVGFFNDATAEKSTAMGSDCSATGFASFVCGHDCLASGIASFADGSGCVASGVYSVAVGELCTSLRRGGVAMGMSSRCNADRGVAIGSACIVEQSNGGALGGSAIAIGEECEAFGAGCVALGYRSKAREEGTAGNWNTGQSFAFGNQADASGTGKFVYRDVCDNTFVFDSGGITGGGQLLINGTPVGGGGGGGGSDAWKETAVGAEKFLEPSANDISGIILWNTIIQGTDLSGLEVGDGLVSSTGRYAVAMGTSCFASGHSALSMGENNTASAITSVALGQSNQATSGQAAVAIGWGNWSYGSGSVALCKNNEASGDYSAVMGYECTTSGTCSFADGSGCLASGDYSVVFGDGGRAVGKGAAAFGTDCSANGWNSIAAGQNSITGGGAGPAIAVGNGCSAHALSIAMGNGCETNGYASVAMGSGCTTTAAIGNNGLIALGDGATAAGSAGFVYQDSCSNTFVFDSGGLSGSGALIINGGAPKTFIIPHPEYEGKMLRHACIETPTRGTNMYEYQIVATEANQTTEIALPSYFKYLNGRPRVYVSPKNVLSTCYGYVTTDKERVIIKTEKVGVFNVMVTGVRQDPKAVAYSSTENIDEPIAAEDIPQPKS